MRARLGSRSGADRPRLAYRDVASATNRTTLIAAIVPARTVTVHTVFCLQSRLALDAQRVLCALLNSYVANYLVRRRVTTHVTASIISRLPVPLVTRASPLFDELCGLAATLERGDDPAATAVAQAAAAEAYGLSDRRPRARARDVSAGPCRPARLGDRGLRQANAATKLAMSSASTMLV